MKLSQSLHMVLMGYSTSFLLLAVPRRKSAALRLHRGQNSPLLYHFIGVSDDRAMCCGATERPLPQAT
jgi:hypothetical protein